MGLNFGMVAHAQEAPPPEEAKPEEAEPDTPAAEEPPAEEPSVEEPTAEEPAPVEPTVTDEAPVAEADSDIEVIFVTGSTIRRTDLVTPAPVAILDKVELDAAGMVNIGDILQNLPSQSNAINTSTNNGGSGATRISVRGLGPARTLVLVNGRRHVYGGLGANASVDLNAIPASIIKRVEVLKDGASAVYGSDAIGGVVNIITRTDFEGAEATLFTSGTESGGSIIDVAVTAGHSADKGNIVFSAGYYKQSPMWTFERSNWATPDKGFDWSGFESGTCDQNAPIDTPESCVFSFGSTATPQGTIIDRIGASGNQAWQDVVASGPRGTFSTSGIYYNDPTIAWRDFRLTGNSDTNAGDFYNYQPENYLRTPQERYNVFSTGSFSFHDHVRGFFEASYMNRSSSQKLAPTPLFIISEEIAVAPDNFYNPFGRPFIDVRRRFVEASNRNFIQNLDTFRFVGGFDGDVPIPVGSNWNYELAYNFGRTQGTEINEGRFVRSRVENAIGPSFVGGDGSVTCGTQSTPIPGCVPLNLFGGPGTITQEMLDYISYDGISRGFTDLQSVTANLTGQLGELPFGGPIGLAVGVEHRVVGGASLPDPITASGDTTGNKQEPTAGSYSVNEAFGELNLELIKDKPGVETLELTAAVRAFDYDTFGSGATWKVGGRWQVVSDAAFRGTVSTAFRAPSIGELFSGAADSFPAVRDPCDTSRGPVTDPIVAANCMADGLPTNYVDTRTQLKSRVGGNPDLDPETARVWTAGAVFEPKALKGFTLTVDYFNVKIDESIQAVGENIILSNCYAKTDVQAERSNCDQIRRNSSGFISVIEDTQQNIGTVKTSGVDIFARYDYKSPVGKFRFSLDTSWLQKYNVRQGDGTLREGKGVYDLGVFPAVKWNFSTLWSKDKLAAGVNVRFIGGFRECEDDDCKVQEDVNGNPVFPNDRDVDANITADIFASYVLNTGFGGTKLTLGMNNALNQDPARVFNGFIAGTDPNTYDIMGRVFYVRLSQSL